MPSEKICVDVLYVLQEFQWELWTLFGIKFGMKNLGT